VPLRDHFRPPLGYLIDGLSIHGGWAATVAFHLNRHMPPGHRAIPVMNFGLEIDLATYRGQDTATPDSGTAPTGWAPGAPEITAVVPEAEDAVEVRVYRIGEHRVLVGAIEFVSPANKDRTTKRNAFLAKCAEILRGGAGLVIVDVVTSRTFNLHGELMRQFLNQAPATPEPEQYAVAYRPIRDDLDRLTVEMWPHALLVGTPLPTLPLWLAGQYLLAVDLETTYEETCRNLLLPPLE
jgi:hypothetical protein